MKASELIAQLQETVAVYGDLDVVYSVDEEGNSFHEVYFSPRPGNFNDNDFLSKDIIEEEDDLDEKEYPINAICVN